MANNKTRRLLLLDWDGTASQNSTLPLIAGIAALQPPPLTDDVPPFSYFSTAWLSDCNTHASTYTPPAICRHDPLAEMNWLDSLADIEEASIHRLERSGLWRGVTGPKGTAAAKANQAGAHISNDIEAAAIKAARNDLISLRPGLANLISQVHMSGGAVAIISVSWSAAWIARALTELGFPSKSAAIAKECGIKDRNVIYVYANEIDPSGSGNLSRGLPIIGTYPGVEDAVLEQRFDRQGRGIWTAKDKAAAARLAVADFIAGTPLVPTLGHGRGISGKAPPWSEWRTAYVGDSCVDLACLLDSDMAICIRDKELNKEQQELAETLERIGITCSPIQHKNIATEDQAENSQGVKDTSEVSGTADEYEIFWAFDFEEVRTALFDV